MREPIEKGWLMTSQELAVLLGIDRSTVSRMVSSGQPVAGMYPVWLTDYTYRWRRSDVVRVLGLDEVA